MNLRNSISKNVAGLTLEELEELASEIRELITHGTGMTISDYVKRASEVDHLEFGYRKSKAICLEPKLEVYFPDEVYQVLRERFLAVKQFIFNDDDRRFMMHHSQKGTKWIAKKMYTSVHRISEVSRRDDLHVKTQFDNYTPEVINFITVHADKGYQWIASELNLSKETVRHKMKRMGLWKKEEHNV